ncbi:chloride channel protein [Xanthovirga aplysinae]|uniref:chloride channel protein n=1 Tax=Xanthovirga aplysinae TaxID=2529853 RepID=UPI0012BCFC20|nr:chloride channel protein [Xanthovirga aplysinae]MTI31685.1 chloride channel protein [Xanthovirga aplysinae]
MNEFLGKFLVWRVKYVGNKNFVLIISGLVGLLAGLAAVSLKESVHYIQHILSVGAQNFNMLITIIYPLVGILLTVFLTHVILKIKLGHGIPDILFTIAKKSGIIERHKTFSSMLSSFLTVGFGGSVGLEAPIVVTGSAIGSNIAQAMSLNYRQRTLLIGCGAAGAISAIFNSPVAGVLFAIELILSEVTIASFIPLLISSVFGYLVSMTLSGKEMLFFFTLKDPFTAYDVPFYMVFGVVCGFVALYFTRVITSMEGWLKNKLKGTWERALLGGLALVGVIFIFPPLYGEGYDTVKALLNGNEHFMLDKSYFFNDFSSVGVILLFSLGIVLFKPIATALTGGSGGSSGTFGPAMVVGGVSGFLFAKLTNLVFWGETISTSNFTLVGMCGVMAAVLRAPLTGIFLIAEVTSGYTLFVPLMLVAAIAYSTISYFEKYSLYTKSLIEKGDLIKDDKDRQVLSLIHLNQIIEKDLLTIHPEARLGDLAGLVKVSKRNIFPVVDEHEKLVGIVTLDDIREIMFDKESQESINVATLMHPAPASVSSFESMESVMRKFECSGAWNLPVIDEGKYVGLVSKSRIFNAYRKKLVRQSRELSNSY